MVVVVKVSPVDRDLCSRAAHLDLPVLCPPRLLLSCPPIRAPGLQVATCQMARSSQQYEWFSLELSTDFQTTREIFI